LHYLQGVPSVVRCDMGSENTTIALKMLMIITVFLYIITHMVVGVYRDWPGCSALNLQFFTFTMEAI